MPDVICLGELLAEFVATERNVPLSSVSHWHGALPGGAPANVAVATSKLGDLSTAFVGCVGNDPFGNKLRQILSSVDVDTSFLLHDEDVRTTMVFTAVFDDGHKELCFYRGADRCLKKEYITMEVFSQARCLHYGSITLIDSPASQAQRHAIRMARDRGLFLTYDPNYRPTLWPDKETAQDVMFEALKYAHMAKISEEEFSAVTGQKDLQAGMRAVLDQGVELLIVSRGHRGALATNGEFVVESAAIDGIKIVETTGSGDAFQASMISRMLPEFEKLGGTLKHVDEVVVQSALDYANVVAGLTCTKVGAIPAMPTPAEVSRFLVTRHEVKAPLRLSPHDLARMIDHTMLKPYCVQSEDTDLEKLCREAREFGFAMVAVNPAQVETCCKLLQGAVVRVGAAIGFPLGQTTTCVKAYETQNALEHGAREIDVVLNVRDLQSGKDDLVQTEIESVVKICREFSERRDSRVICKVILETCYLTTEQKVKACEICRNAGVDFVKTSTGFGPAGATVADVKLIRQTVGDAVGVKASGGIRDLATARAMIAAGANRIGTSNGVAIMKELLKEQSVGNS